MICKAVAAAKGHTSGQEDAWFQLAIGNYERYVDLLKHARGSVGFEAKKQERLEILARYREAARF